MRATSTALMVQPGEAAGAWLTDSAFELLADGARSAPTGSLPPGPCPDARPA
nr:hypothetical protein [Streptomyces antibioticus]